MRHHRIELDLKRMTAAAMSACARRGYPVNDPEYASAINQAVWEAAKEKKPRSKYTTIAAVYALRACGKVNLHLKKIEESDRAVARPEITTISTIETPLSDVEFNLLSYVAANGLGPSAKALEMRPDHLRERLDQIALRIRQSRREQES